MRVRRDNTAIKRNKLTRHRNGWGPVHPVLTFLCYVLTNLTTQVDTIASKITFDTVRPEHATFRSTQPMPAIFDQTLFQTRYYLRNTKNQQH